jgi:hypothetical protein
MRGEGKNDPRRPVYWKLLGFSEEESTSKAKLECKKCSPRCVEYWIKRGFSENEAMQQIKIIQNNGEKNIGSKRTEEQKLNMKKSQESINTLEHWIEKYGKDIGTYKFEEFKKNKSKIGKLGINARLSINQNTFIDGSIRRPEYWIKRGYSEEESKIMVSKLQSRGIEFYIKKYGNEVGKEKWKKRNDKWFKSFYNSDKDLIEINKKRKLNSHVGYYTENTIVDIDNLNFYMIVLVDIDDTMIIKYGLTKQDTIAKRWSVSLNYNLLLFNKMKSLNAVKLENEFHKHFKSSYTPSVIKTTECFKYTEDNLNKALEILEEFKND